MNLHNYLIKQECNKSEVLGVRDENYNGISYETVLRLKLFDCLIFDVIMLLKNQHVYPSCILFSLDNG